MPRQLTPEEMKIIRKTEEEGARIAAQEEKSPRDAVSRLTYIIKGAAIFIIVFAAFACIAYAIVSGTAK